MIEFEARLPWQANLQQHSIGADRDNVTDTDVALVHVRRNKVLPETPGLKPRRGGGEFGAPFRVVGRTVYPTVSDKYGRVGYGGEVRARGDRKLVYHCVMHHDSHPWIALSLPP